MRKIAMPAWGFDLGEDEKFAESNIGDEESEDADSLDE